MIDIIPAIDLIDGHAVRLTKGDYGQKKVYDSDPVSVAERFAALGAKRIHMVDLDGAKASSPRNLRVLEKAASVTEAEIEWGGGICSEADLDDVFSAGASYAVIGSIAVKNGDLFSSWLEKFGERMILGADAADGKIAVKGWLEKTEVTVSGLVEKFRKEGLKSVICTDISRDGMLEGPATQLYVDLMREFPDICFTASGGVSCMDDIRALDAAGVPKVIVGKAIYEGKITSEDIAGWLRNE